jgi:hypothetical protein
MAVFSFQKIISSTALLFTITGASQPDNQNIVHILNKGSRKIDLQQISIKIANVCTLHNIVLLPEWVPREENVKADKISKSTDCDDWEIDEDVFTKLSFLSYRR